MSTTWPRTAASRSSSRRIIRRDRYRTHLSSCRSASAASRRLGAGRPAAARHHERSRARRLAAPLARTPATWRSSGASPTTRTSRPTCASSRPAAGASAGSAATGFGSVGEVAWSPDGSRLAFTAEVDPPRFLVGRRAGAGPDRNRWPVGDRSPLARRITRTDWRWDGVGHLDRWCAPVRRRRDAGRRGRARSPRATGACRTSPGARTDGPSRSPRRAARTPTSCRARRSGRWTSTPPLPSRARSWPRPAGPTTPRSRRTGAGSSRSASTSPSRSTT